jgi:predicted lipoprotein with Yx(FWY)xxD motif
MRKVYGAAALAAIALALAACGSSGGSAGSAGTSAPAASSAPAPPASSAPAGAGGALSTRNINGTSVLTNSAGLTLYWFAPDTPTTSKCSGSCATYWPPVKGPVTAGTGVPGKLGTITRPDGSTQATYDGHPLYTYAADTAPGQNKGNGLNASGGLWHEMTVSGALAAAAVPSASTISAGGGGY